MKVVVGMSGGVDSSVCALLLKQQGYDTIGMFMKNWDEKDDEGVCSAADDARDVRLVAQKIGIPHYTVNFVKEYWDKVFEYFLYEYKMGRTPNPDVLCNKEIKFKAFLNRALETGASKIATGHYANVEYSDGFYRLKKAKDTNKDQTYFLCMLNQYQLSKAIFPLGNLTKPEVREIARKNDLSTANKKDSTGVCFIGERNFKEFLQKYLPNQKGDIKSVDGKVVGKHDGLMYYTLGQRKGLGIGGCGDGRSWFVVDKDLKNNVLLVVQGDDSSLLYSKGLTGSNIHFIANTYKSGFECKAKFRYRQSEQDCFVTYDDKGCHIEFKENQKAVTPGQFAVLYMGDECIGNAIISAVEKI